MRTTREAKARLKDEILRSSIPYLKESGPHGIPVDEVMKNLGLTSGALYSHFQSKEDFTNQVILYELRRRNDVLRESVRTKGPRAILSWIESYLSDSHTDNVQKGCVFAALGPDMKRARPQVRNLFEQEINETFKILAEALPQGSPSERANQVRFMLSSMLGALTLSRSGRSKKFARDLLGATRHQLEAML